MRVPVLDSTAYRCAAIATRGAYRRGSLRQRGERRWELRVSAGRDPVTRRYRYVSRSFQGTRKQATIALAALVAEVTAGGGGHRGTDVTLANLSSSGSTCAGSASR